MNADGRYQLVPLDARGRYHSVVVPGFWLRPEWLWQDPSPDVSLLLAMIATDALRGRVDAAEAMKRAEVENE
jgi:hypothetical protein